MRIHTNYLLPTDLSDAMNHAKGKAPDVDLHVQSRHGSRTRSRAFEVALRGHGARHTRRPNTGFGGANTDEYAATYDDWGWFLSAVFARDGNAWAGPYKGRNDFHDRTKNKYAY